MSDIKVSVTYVDQLGDQAEKAAEVKMREGLQLGEFVATLEAFPSTIFGGTDPDGQPARFRCGSVLRYTVAAEIREVPQ